MSQGPAGSRSHPSSLAHAAVSHVICPQQSNQAAFDTLGRGHVTPGGVSCQRLCLNDGLVLLGLIQGLTFKCTEKKYGFQR